MLLFPTERITLEMTPCECIHMLSYVHLPADGTDNNAVAIKMSVRPTNSLNFPVPSFQTRVTLSSSTIQERNTCVFVRATRFYIILAPLAIAILFRKKFIKLKIIDLCCHKKEY